MNEFAKLFMQGVALIISFIAFATVKGKLLNAIMIFNIIACGVAFYTNYYSNFAGV